MFRALAAIVARELRRMLRQRGRLVSAVVRPLIWLIIMGSGYKSLLSDTGNYQQYLAPGLIAMVLLFGSILASLSMVYDKESGVMRMLVIAPFPRYWIVVSRTLSATLVGITQAVIFLAVLMILGFIDRIPHPVLLLSGYLLTALACASLGMLIAVFSEALDDFAVIMNFVIFPVFFLSGALYPLQNLPDLLRMLALINPFSYGVDLLKHALLSTDVSVLGADLALIHDIVFLVLFILIAVASASVRFSQTPVVENLAKRLSTRRR